MRLRFTATANRMLRGVDLFASLDDKQRAQIAAATVVEDLGDGEAIVRQGEPGESMCVLASGKVSVVIEPDRRQVATIEKGGYFGEMSLLTGSRVLRRSSPAVKLSSLS